MDGAGKENEKFKDAETTTKQRLHDSGMRRIYLMY